MSVGRSVGLSVCPPLQKKVYLAAFLSTYLSTYTSESSDSSDISESSDSCVSRDISDISDSNDSSDSSDPKNLLHKKKLFPPCGLCDVRLRQRSMEKEGPVKRLANTRKQPRAPLRSTCLFTRLEESSLVPAGFLTSQFLQKS